MVHLLLLQHKKLHMITKIKRDWRDSSSAKILIEYVIFDRRPDKSGKITGQVWKTLLEPGEKGRTCLVSKTGHSSLHT
jgi:hypothetical protein